MARRKDFIYSNEKEPHRDRTRKILREHPEIRQLIGKNPYSILIIIGFVSFQFAMSWFMGDKSWWIVFGAAYLLGAFADHALFVMIHECAHNLLFKTRKYNTLAGILANTPQVAPSSVSFAHYHIKHHSFQGIHELDGDLPNRWEAKLINNFFIGKAIWLLLYPLFQITRIPRLREIRHFNGWVLLNWVVQITVSALVCYFWGAHSFVYLLASFFFSVGLHPVGGRWIQEHYLTKGEQETYSYYGVLNTVAFNVGHHNEHHDFPSIPWNRLPKVRSTAPKWYNSLQYHTSWTLLLLRFLFDRELSLFSRIVRKNRGEVPLNDESKPDREILMKETLVN
jgi:sphingolipid 4-desaturase/C4-monooxygenase